MTKSQPQGPATDEVVVGVGDSEASIAALSWAVSTAAQHGWSVVALTAWPDPEAPFIHSVPGHYCEPRARAVARLDRALSDAVRGSGLGTEDLSTVERLVENAHPVDALVARSHGARMLVVGTSEAHQTPHVPVGLLCSSLADCPVVQVDPIIEEGPVVQANAVNQVDRRADSPSRRSPRADIRVSASSL